MKKLSTYFTIFCIIFGYCEGVVAGTSIISNVLTQSNSYLKEAGLIQKKYSGIAREYASAKVGDPDNLAESEIAAVKAQAESIKEQAEKTREQIAMAQETQAAAKARIEDINAGIASLQESAEAGLAEGKAILEQYKISAPEHIDEAENTAEIADDADDTDGDDAEGGLDEEELTENGIADTNVDNTIKKPQQEVGGFRRPVDRRNNQPAQLLEGVNRLAVSDVKIKQQQALLSNRAAAIQSAAIMADDTRVNSVEMPALPDAQTISVPSTSVSALDVMADAEIRPVKEVDKSILQSDLNLEEQLRQSSNQIEKNDIRVIGRQKVINKENSFETVVDKRKVRQKFDTDKVDLKNIKNETSDSERKIFEGAVKKQILPATGR